MLGRRERKKQRSREGDTGGINTHSKISKRYKEEETETDMNGDDSRVD